MVSTTAMFVEIFVIGVGAFGIILLIFFTFVPIDFAPNFLQHLSFMLVPALALTYILGNIIDRFADRVVDLWDDKYKQEFFPVRTTRNEPDKDSENREYHAKYAEARTWVYIWSASARATFEYGKSRIRVCRGWIVNSAALLLASLLFSAYSPRVADDLRISVGGFLCTLFLVLFVCSAAAWRVLSRDHFYRLGKYYEELSKYRSKTDGLAVNDELRLAAAAAILKHGQANSKLLGLGSTKPGNLDFPEQ